MTPGRQSRQTGVFSVPLERIVNPEHPLCVLAAQIDWNGFDTAFGPLYHPGNGRPGTPIDPSMMTRWRNRLKGDGRLGRNWLKGAEGDRMNAILSGCGHNIRKSALWLLFLLFFVRPVVSQTRRIGEREDTLSNATA